MLRTTKWKLEKAKVKVVFRLQFHATNIPQSGWEKLFICLIPTESGRIIAKTSKASVRNGTCKWADPIYETTRLLVDSRNKQYDDKLYKLIVGMGTSRCSILGEATINLADYVDALDPFDVALPLHGSDHGTILHVTVQLLTAKTGFREFEQQFDRGLQSSNNINREVEPSIATSSSSEFQTSNFHFNKVNTRTHFKTESKELYSIMEETGQHEEYSDSLVESDNPLGLTGPAHSQGPPTEKQDRSDYSLDNDLIIAHEENQRLKGSLERAESSICELKMELNSLHNHANEMNMETQKISDHLMAEISSGQKLEREVRVLRSECLKFKDELEELKEIKLRPIQEPRFTSGFDLVESQSLELLSQLDEAKSEKGNLVRKMNEMECYYEALVQELEENRDRILVEFWNLKNEHSTCFYTISTCKNEAESMRHDMNNQILKFVEERNAFCCVKNKLEKRVAELEENCEQISGEFWSLKNEHSTCADTIFTCKNETESIRIDMNNQILKFVKERHYLDCAKNELEKSRERILLEFQSVNNEHSTCADTISTCKNEIKSIRNEMNDQNLKYSKERDELECVKTELQKRVMSLESVVQELEKNRERILLEFESLKNEHSTCADIISTCKTETESICHGMNDQILKFMEEKNAFGCVKNELEKRVMSLESHVQELDKNREWVLLEFENLKIEHLECKTETDSVHDELHNQNLKLSKEKHDLDCVKNELEKRVMSLESVVQELEKNRERNLLEFKSLQNEHSTCKMGTETICHDMDDQILKLTEERNVFGCAKTELEKRVMDLESHVQDFEKNHEQVLLEFESLKNEHLTCGDIISTCKNETELVRHEMNDQNFKSSKEINDFECVKNELEKRVMSLESHVQELEENRERILLEFNILNILNDSTCKTETESIRDELHNQNSKFSKEKHDLECVKIKLEKRVMGLELALERARLNYSVAVTQLQKDLDMLSSQVSSMFETNQNLIKESLIPLSPNINKNLDDDEFYEIFCANFYLDVYSSTLEQTLFDVNKMKGKNECKVGSESLRLAFMKEQCDTIVEDLKHQLFVSKRHGDDILIKLQDAIDEIESRKKSEASYLKKIEEFSIKIVGLEVELQSTRAELECAILNLECCKEEKEKIIASMHEHELEELKNERSILSIMSSGSSFQDLQRQLVQLHKANEELRSIYPDFKDFQEDGNALERVLALVIELAEALTSKNKSSFQFQSSFLKQHSDQEAIFKSFKDINELIKDTLDIKNKYVNMETELNEMHERYSQLSLQFAEVEGERQKLMMIVKNVRSPIR